MRQEVIDYINTLSLGSFLLSTEYPFEESGTPLYIKNLKKVYVGVTERSDEPLISALNGFTINTDLKIIRVYFSCDAKQLPSNYETLVDDLVKAKDITSIDGIYRRQAVVSTDINSDILVTELELRFTKLST